MSEYLKRNLQYARYLARHKWYVYQAGRITGTPLWRLIIHDWTKLLPSEWTGYRDYFYPSTKANEKFLSRMKIKDRYFTAWNAHLRRNAHHWQYWVTSNDDGTYTTIEIPEQFVREMVADWCGAGRAITGKWDAIEWFAKNERKMKINEETRKLVVQMLDKAMFVLTGPVHA